ncbi:hypothetical protein J6590_055243 [Homalodisca vitripennis]|nr:hypothetical protein J6590_055243 [Homalodisca vitripennis]
MRGLAPGLGLGGPGGIGVICGYYKELIRSMKIFLSVDGPMIEKDSATILGAIKKQNAGISMSDWRVVRDVHTEESRTDQPFDSEGRHTGRATHLQWCLAHRVVTFRRIEWVINSLVPTKLLGGRGETGLLAAGAGYSPSPAVQSFRGPQLHSTILESIQSSVYTEGGEG